MKGKWLRNLNGKITTYKIFGFDIETYGDKNEFLMGSIVGDNIRKVFWNKNEFIDFLFSSPFLSKQARIFATNLQFDILNLFEGTKYFDDLNIVVRNSQFISVKIDIDKKRKLIFLDTANYVPFSVKQLGKIVGLEKLPIPDYIKENRKPKPEEYKYIEEYNLRDSEITYRFAKWFQSAINQLGGQLKNTIASTAMDIYRRKYLPHPVKLMEKDDIINHYKAYYGGRVEVLKRGYIENMKYYDFNSLYPSVMLNEYPDPISMKYKEKGKIDIIELYEGISYVLIKAPEIDVPLLPVKHDGKLIFPTGLFSGYYTHLELRKAMDLGYEILKVGEQYYYTQTFPFFREFILENYKKRMEYKEQGNKIELAHKLIMNSLYGKFAQRFDNQEKVYNLNRLSLEDMDKLINKGDVRIIGDFLFLNKKENNIIPPYIIPIFSIYTTAYGRLKLFEYISKYDVYYMDTDSLITKSNLPTSNKLGDLKLEYKIREGILVKPKFYGFIDKNENQIIKIKGLPSAKKWDYNTFLEFIKEPQVKFKKFTKFKESINRGFSFNQIIEVKKTMSLEDDKRWWFNKSFSPYDLQFSSPLSIKEIS